MPSSEIRIPAKNDLAGLLDVKRTLKIKEENNSLGLESDYLVNRMMKTTKISHKKIFSVTGVKRRSLFGKTELDFTS